MSNEMIIYANSTDIIQSTDNSVINRTFSSLAEFSEAIRDGLVDGVDYGIIPGTDKGSLFLSGAEKIKLALGLSVEYDMENCVEEFGDTAFFMYRFRSRVYRGDQLVATGFGAANTRESKYAKQNPYTLQETILLMAKKRAFVNGIREVSCLSSLFTQDMLDDPTSTASRMRVDKTKTTKSGKVTAGQIKRFYAICGVRGMSKEQSNELLAKYGYTSAKEIDQSQYNEICAEADAYREEQ